MKFISTALLSIVTLFSFAQWQPINSSSTDNGNIYHLNGSIGIGTATPNGQLQITGASGWDKSTRVYITNGASDYGRTNLILTGRMQSGNDGWQFGSDSRNSIVFASNYSASGLNVGAIGSEQFSIQHEPHLVNIVSE